MNPRKMEKNYHSKKEEKMKKEYFILLSNEGDFLQILGKDIWKATFDFNKKSIFETYEEAEEYLLDMSIRSIWKEAKVESTLKE
jgi:hypothetical protein